MPTLTFADLCGKSDDEVEDILFEKQDDLFFVYRSYYHDEETENKLEDVLTQLEEDIHILERKLNRRKSQCLKPKMKKF